MTMPKYFPPTDVIFHKGCMDGMTAAWCAAEPAKAKGYRVQFHACHYGDPPPVIPAGSSIAIVDFSFPREVLEAYAAESQIVVLDHHATAEENLRGLDYCVFDIDRSGARLAWDWAHPGEPPPILVLYVQDRDLWKWELPDSREVSAWLHAHSDGEFNFNAFNSLVRKFWLHDLVTSGRALLLDQRRRVNRRAGDVQVLRILGRRVGVVNATEDVSEVCEAILERNQDLDLAAAWRWLGNRQWVAWSLRGREDGESARTLAESFGGGGHRNAAGFVIDWQLHTHLLRLVSPDEHRCGNCGSTVCHECGA